LRNKLKKLLEFIGDRRYTFIGKVTAFAFRNGVNGEVETLCIENLRCLEYEDFGILSNHLWFDIGKFKNLKNISQNTTVKFTGLVNQYKKGTTDSFEIDYTITNIRDDEVINIHDLKLDDIPNDTYVIHTQFDDKILIDEEDYSKVKDYKWIIHEFGEHKNAITYLNDKSGVGKPLAMQNILYPELIGKFKLKDEDYLDLRRENIIFPEEDSLLESTDLENMEDVDVTTSEVNELEENTISDNNSNINPKIETKSNAEGSEETIETYSIDISLSLEEYEIIKTAAFIENEDADDYIRKIILDYSKNTYGDKIIQILAIKDK